MLKRPKISRLSNTRLPEGRKGNAVVIIGSFAPIHNGHFDAAFSACASLTEREIHVESLVLTPNSAEYVRRKLPEDHERWTYEYRTQRILAETPHPDIPTYVDDVSGSAEHEELILNSRVPVTIRRHLGFLASQLYLVVGSDQLLSLQSHFESEESKAVCVLRPSYLDSVKEQLETPWVSEAIRSERFIITEQQDMTNIISSSAIRRSEVIV